MRRLKDGRKERRKELLPSTVRPSRPSYIHTVADKLQAQHSHRPNAVRSMFMVTPHTPLSGLDQEVQRLSVMRAAVLVADFIFVVVSERPRTMGNICVHKVVMQKKKV